MRIQVLKLRLSSKIGIVAVVAMLLFQVVSVQGEEITCTVDPSLNRVRMQITIMANCSHLNASGKQMFERLNYQFQSQQMSQGIVQQARLTFTNRLQQMLGNNISVNSLNMTYRYTPENQTFGLTANITINGPISFNGSSYLVRTHWRWINASGDCEFEHQQSRYRFNFAEMMGLDLSKFNVPLEQWTRQRDQTQNMTRYTLTVPPYNISTPYGSILIDPTQVIETPGETYAAGDLIQLGSTPIPEFEMAQLSLLIIISLIAVRMVKKKPISTCAMAYSAS